MMTPFWLLASLLMPTAVWSLTPVSQPIDRRLVSENLNINTAQARQHYRVLMSDADFERICHHGDFARILHRKFDERRKPVFFDRKNRPRAALRPWFLSSFM